MEHHSCGVLYAPSRLDARKPRNINEHSSVYIFNVEPPLLFGITINSTKHPFLAIILLPTSQLHLSPRRTISKPTVFTRKTIITLVAAFLSTSNAATLNLYSDTDCRTATGSSNVCDNT